jgi:hypothetical protein
MNGVKYIKTKRLIFSQWSGKNYAVFASLGRVVNISSLTIDICVQSIKKTLSVIGSFIGAEEIEDSSPVEYGKDINEIIQVELGTIQLQPVVVKSALDYCDKKLNFRRY